MAAVCSNVVVARCAGGVTTARLSARQSIRPAGSASVGCVGATGTGVFTLGRARVGARNRAAVGQISLVLATS